MRGGEIPNSGLGGHAEVECAGPHHRVLPDSSATARHSERRPRYGDSMPLTGTILTAGKQWEPLTDPRQAPPGYEDSSHTLC